MLSYSSSWLSFLTKSNYTAVYNVLPNAVDPYALYITIMHQYWRIGFKESDTVWGIVGWRHVTD